MMVRGEDENCVFFVNREEAGGSDRGKVSLHRAALKRVYEKGGGTLCLPKAILLFEVVEENGGSWRYEKTSIDDPAVIAEVVDLVFSSVDAVESDGDSEYGRKVWIPRLQSMVYGGEYDIIIDREQNTAYFVMKNKGDCSLLKPFEWRVILDRNTSEVYIRGEHGLDGGAENYSFRGWKVITEIENLFFSESYNCYIDKFTRLLAPLHANIPLYRKTLKRLAESASKVSVLPPCLKKDGVGELLSKNPSVRVEREPGETWLRFTENSLTLGLYGESRTPIFGNGSVLYVHNIDSTGERGRYIGSPEHAGDFEGECEIPAERANSYAMQFAKSVVRRALQRGELLERLYENTKVLVSELQRKMVLAESLANLDLKDFHEKVAIKADHLSVAEFWDEYREHIRAGRNHAVVDGCYSEETLTEDLFEAHCVFKTPKGLRIRNLNWQPDIDHFDSCIAMRFKDGTTMYSFIMPPKRSRNMCVTFVSASDYESGEGAKEN